MTEPVETGRPRSGTRRASVDLAQPGDWVEVDGIGGAGPRRGEIVEVLGTAGHVHFHVRWAGEEEHESLYYPADGGCIVHASGQ